MRGLPEEQAMLEAWIAEVFDWTQFKPELREGNWHGYLNDGNGTPMRGRYVLLRWKAPTVAISSDNRMQLFRLAIKIEEAMT